MFTFWRKIKSPPTNEEIKIATLIANYPLYNPPHWAHILALSTDAFQENRDYFLSNAEARIDCLRQFFGEFGVAVDFSNEAIIGISCWLADHILAFPPAISIEFGSDARNLFYNYTGPWDADYRVLNFLFDLGIFFGQTIVSRRKKAYWHFVGGFDDYNPKFIHQSITVRGVSAKPIDPFEMTSMIIMEIRNDALLIKSRRCRNPEFVRRYDRSNLANNLRVFADNKYKGPEWV